MLEVDWTQEDVQLLTQPWPMMVIIAAVRWKRKAGITRDTKAPFVEGSAQEASEEAERNRLFSNMATVIVDDGSGAAIAVVRTS